MVVFSHRRLDERGIEPRTTPMLREYYTTKPFALEYHAFMNSPYIIVALARTRPEI